MQRINRMSGIVPIGMSLMATTNAGHQSKSSSKWLPFVWPLDQWPSSECHGGKLYR
jgi:hypothetical protein